MTEASAESTTRGRLASWVPILTGNARTDAWAAIHEISSALLKPTRTFTPSLASGSAGAALFFATLGRAQPDRGEFLDHAADELSRSIDGIATGRQLPRLYAGFTGVAWAAEQCRFLLSADDDPNTDVDEALAAYVSQKPWKEDYDLISGLIGYGLYALERDNAQLLDIIIHQLSEIAEANVDGITWHTAARLLNGPQRELYPNGYYNLGLAHGVPGVIALLAQACAAGVAVETARPLLDGAVRWLLAAKNPSDSEFLYRYVVAKRPTEDKRGPSRVAWCYGDLGVALALLWAARSVGEPAWEAEALDIARHVARRPLDRSGVVDASVCHGSAGNAHLFNRLYQATRDPMFLQTAREWFAWTLRFRQPDKGVAGFLAWNGHGWDPIPGVLEGAAGIGLALIAAVSTLRPDWDRMLMVSVPPR